MSMINEIENLIEEYEFSLTDTEKDCLAEEINLCVAMTIDDCKYMNLSDKLQIAELIKFLRSCMGSEIILSGTVKHPYQGQIEGWNTKCCISDFRLLVCMEEWLNSFLYKEQFGIYQDSTDIGDIDEPYSDEALNRIIEREKTAKERRYTVGAKIGSKCGWLLTAIQESQVIPEDTPKTKLYSFVYDCLVLFHEAGSIGKGYRGDIGREKYTKIRDWIRTAKNQRKKIAEIT